MIIIFSAYVVSLSDGKKYDVTKVKIARRSKKGAKHNAALLLLRSLEDLSIPVKLKPICLSHDTGKLSPGDQVKGNEASHY